jgi:5-methylcytosine-specific restriction protein A
MTTMLFQRALTTWMANARKAGRASVRINAGALHRIVGGYPGPNHRMPLCCHVMRAQMRTGDRIISHPPKGNGASLTIEYRV